MGKPTAATFFAAKSTADKNKIQALLDRVAGTADRAEVLAHATILCSTLGGDDRDQLMSIINQQLAAR